MHHRLDFLAHVVILVFDLYRAASWVFHVGLAYKMFYLAFAALETGAVVVADDVCERCLLYASFNAYKMVETFVAFGVLRSLPTRKHCYEVVGDAD